MASQFNIFRSMVVLVLLLTASHAIANSQAASGPVGPTYDRSFFYNQKLANLSLRMTIKEAEKTLTSNGFTISRKAVTPPPNINCRARPFIWDVTGVKGNIEVTITSTPPLPILVSRVRAITYKEHHSSYDHIARYNTITSKIGAPSSTSSSIPETGIETLFDGPSIYYKIADYSSTPRNNSILGQSMQVMTSPDMTKISLSDSSYSREKAEQYKKYINTLKTLDNTFNTKAFCS